MIIKEFKNLSDIEKEKEGWLYGKLLTNITFDNQVYDIYQLFDFYVSLSYDVKNTLKAIIYSQVYPEMLPIIRNIYKSG